MEKVWNSDELLPKKIKSIMKITLLFLNPCGDKCTNKP